MTATVLSPTPPRRHRTRPGGLLAGLLAWHPPLIILAVLMGLCALFCVVAALVDPTMITGAERWLKPLKFSISIAVYAFSWALLISRLARHRRLASGLATASAVLLALEMTIIIGQAARGTTSHFNNTTDLNAWLYRTMGMGISLVWVFTLVVGVLVAVRPPAEGPLRTAVRWGVGVSLLGMGLGILMVIPTRAQIATDSDILGAHTVGAVDGGPGLPFVGWSTVAGDLRIGHFLGMHALQLVPLVAVLLAVAGRRIPRLAVEATRRRLVVVVAVGYLGVVATVTVQALRGESVAHPGPATIVGVAGWLVAGVVATVVVLTRPGDAPSATDATASGARTA